MVALNDPHARLRAALAGAVDTHKLDELPISITELIAAAHDSLAHIDAVAALPADAAEDKLTSGRVMQTLLVLGMSVQTGDLSEAPQDFKAGVLHAMEHVMTAITAEPEENPT